MKPVAHDDTQFTGPKRTLSLEPLEQRLLLQANWTFMVYMNGDNDMESAAIDDFLKMAHVGSNANVNIVVQIDRSPLNQGNGGTGYTDSYGDWSDTQRGLVAKNDLPTASWGTAIGSADMGDPAVLTDFLTYAMTNYKADHYALIMFGPGDGYNGVSFDDTSSDFLTMTGLQTGIANGLTAASVSKLDLLGFDGSVMGQVEVADQVKTLSNVMVAAENVAATDGMPYDQVLAQLEATPLMKASDLGGTIASDSLKFYAYQGNFAVVDLNEMGPLASSLDSFAQTFINDGTASDRHEMENIWQTVASFWTFDQLDLGVLMTDIASDTTMSQPIRDAANNVLGVFGDTIISDWAGNTPFSGSGLTIYLPDTSETVDPNYNGGNLLFAAETHWDEFLDSWTTPAPTTQWTFMVYMCGDNNLEGYALQDFLEMSGVGSTDAVKIVVELDRSAGYDTSFGNWTDTRRGLVLQGDVPDTSWGTSIGEADMGDGATLTDFVNWAEVTYPAQHYVLTLWDHGDGLGGAIFDDNNGLGQPDNLTVSEMDQSLQATASPIDILRFDACDMSMLEVAYQMRNDASYMVGSEDLGWLVGGLGFLSPYDEILSNLTTNPSTTARDLSVMMADAYFHSWPAGNLTIMNSVIDLSRVQALAQDMNNLAQTAVAQGSISDRILLAKHRDDVPVYPDPTYAGPPNDARDLGMWLQEVSSDTGITPAISAAAGTALADYNDAIIANFSTAGTGTGMAIYMPQGAPDGTYTWQNFSFAADTQWGDFLTWWTTDQITPVAFFQSGNVKVSFFDTSGVLDVNPANLLVKFSGKGVASITLMGSDPMGGLGIVISGANSVGSIIDKRTAPGQIAFIASNTGAKSVQINSAISGDWLNGRSLGGLIFPSDITGDGNPFDTTSLYFNGGIGKLFVNGSLFSDAFIGGAVSSMQINGDLYGDSVINGNVGKMMFSGLDSGWIFTGLHVKGSIGQLSMPNGGLVEGSLLDISGSLSKANIGYISAGQVNIATDLTVAPYTTIDPLAFDPNSVNFSYIPGATLRAKGGIGQIFVNVFYPGAVFYNKPTSGSSSPLDGPVGVDQRWFIQYLMSNVLAPNIGSMTVGFAMDDARVLAGTDLGADFMPGGIGANADTYGIGHIGSLTVGVRPKGGAYFLPIEVVATDTTDYGWGCIQDSIVGAGLFRSGVFGVDTWGGSGYNLVPLHDQYMFEKGSGIGSVTVAAHIVSSFSQIGWVGNDFSTDTPPVFPYFVPFGVGSYQIGKLNVNGFPESVASVQASFGVWYRDPYVFVQTPRGLGANG